MTDTAVPAAPVKRVLRWQHANGAPVEIVQAELSYRGLLPHFHDTWSLGLILSGRCRFHSGGREYLVDTGDLFAMPPYELHASAAAMGTVRYAVAYLDADWLARHARNADPTAWAPGTRRVWHRPALAARVADLLNAADLSPSVQTELAQAFSRLGLPGGPDSAPAPKAVRTLCRLFQQRWLEPVPLSALTEGLGCSRAHLIRQFRRHTGLAPGAYLRQLRCMKARHLLRQRQALTDVAHALQFADQAHFSREFKKVFGVPPGEFARVMSQDAIAAAI